VKLCRSARSRRTVKHIILVTYGEPTSSRLAEQLSYSWRLMQGVSRTTAAIAAPLLPLLAARRAWERRALWRKHDYRSPLEPNTLAQAAQLRSALGRLAPGSWKIHVAYEFREPLLPDVIAAQNPREAIVVVPMYPADAGFTHDLTRRSAEQLDQRRPAPIIVLPPLDVERLASMSADHVVDMIVAAPGRAEDVALVLAARCMRLNPARAVSTGYSALERLGQSLAKRLQNRFGMVARGWINHGRGARWTAPSIGDALKRVGEAGFTEVVYYPYGFLADNADSQLQGQLAAAAHPQLKVRFVPCLNGSSALADAIASDIVAAH
jgi:protoheme ferro-lyase